MELRRAGDEKGALEKLKAAHELAHTPVTGLELARSYLALGQLVEAQTTARDVVTMPESGETPRTRQARADAKTLSAEIQPRIPAVTVRLAGPSGGAATGAQLRIDGEGVPAAAIGQPRLVNPGKHALEAEAPGAALLKRDFELREGQQLTLDLKLLPAPSASSAGSASAAPPLPPPPPLASSAPAATHGPRREGSSGSTIRTAGWITASSGVVAIGLSGLLGLVAKADYSASGGGCDAQNRCNSEDSVQKGKAAHNLADGGTAFFIVGAVAVVGGLSMVIFAPADDRPSLEAGLSGPGAFLRGRF
jgi:hypothetical protein